MKSIYIKNIFLISLVLLVSIFLFSSKTSADIENLGRDQQAKNNIENPDLEKEAQLTERDARINPIVPLDIPPALIKMNNIDNIEKNIKVFTRTYRDGDLAPDCEFDECNFDSVFKLGNDILDFLIALAVTLAAFAAIVIGFKLLFATGNPTKLNEAKEIAKLYLIGFIILLSSWLIVKAVFEILGAKSDPFAEIDKK